jgi:hypothetical protein
VFAQALLERDAAATAEEVERAREKAFRAPWLMLVVVDGPGGDRPDVDLAERILSAGCAVQNLLLMSTALGFGSALTSGKALKSDACGACSRWAHRRTGPVLHQHRHRDQPQAGAAAAGGGRLLPAAGRTRLRFRTLTIRQATHEHLHL